MLSEEEVVIIDGVRGTEFKSKIVSILKKGKLKQEYIDKITDDESMRLYDIAFTHPTANELENYEFWEILGDAAVNKAVVFYLSNRFPQLRNPKGVKIIARLKINLISKKTFAEFGEKLGFWKFVTADEDTKKTQLRKTLEDVFEAFLGLTEYLIDTKLVRNGGYAVCYKVIEYLFGKYKSDISLRYEDLYDAKTRLKETFDLFNKDKSFGKVEYQKFPRKLEDERGPLEKWQINLMLETYGRNWENKWNDGYQIQFVRIYKVYENTKELLGEAAGSLLSDVQKAGAEIGIQYLKQQGIEKPIDDFYKTLI